MKAILVVDVEEYGNYYVDVYRKDDGNRFEDRFEGRYYLKPMPSRKYNDESVMVGSLEMDLGYILGWNTCIEELEK